MKPEVAIFWFRRDLRLNDNTGLFHALRSGLPVVPVFIYDSEILQKLESKSDQRLLFIYHHLKILHNELLKQGSGLVTYYDSPQNAWKKIIQKFNVKSVYINEDYEPDARERDALLCNFLNNKAISFNAFKDQVVFGPGEILKDDGTPYTIYTPYKNKWRSNINSAQLKTYPSEKYSDCFVKMPVQKILTLKDFGFKEVETSFPDKGISKKVLKEYASLRDFPALDATTKVSVHLRFGTLSIRKLVSFAFSVSETWVNELIWREFYMMILFQFPYVVKGAFKPKFNFINWRNNEKEFARWCSGQTGYPIVDAGMRELNATGFMHNRVRMITAGFLTKHLLIDWRWGEAYFAKKLLDFELSSNNGGWQWAAGTGCDAAPYFRIFSPYEQTRKFDPQWVYIRKWVPEFEDISYPNPIVEHKAARERCLKVFKNSLGIASGF